MAIVTLTTDFGSADVYAAAMKGVILSMAPGTVLVDITMEWHDRRLAVVAGRTYSDVIPGGLVLYPGSSGQIELAVRDGSASEQTGARRGTRFRLRRTE
jgi:S-adenosylmethionine hydrolase